MGVTDKLAYCVHKMGLLCAFSVVIGFQIPYLDNATKCMKKKNHSFSLPFLSVHACGGVTGCNPMWSVSTANQHEQRINSFRICDMCTLNVQTTKHSTAVLNSVM